MTKNIPFPKIENYPAVEKYTITTTHSSFQGKTLLFSIRLEPETGSKNVTLLCDIEGIWQAKEFMCFYGDDNEKYHLKNTDENHKKLQDLVTKIHEMLEDKIFIFDNLISYTTGPDIISFNLRMEYPDNKDGENNRIQLNKYTIAPTADTIFSMLENGGVFQYGGFPIQLNEIALKVIKNSLEEYVKNNSPSNPSPADYYTGQLKARLN